MEAKSSQVSEPATSSEDRLARLNLISDSDSDEPRSKRLTTVSDYDECECQLKRLTLTTPEFQPKKKKSWSVLYRDNGKFRISFLNLYSKERADYLNKLLLDETPFITHRVPSKKYQRETIKRNIAAYGGKYCPYEFHDTFIHGEKWTPLILQIKHDVESWVKAQYNFVLIEYHPNGKSKCERHQDYEWCIDRNAPISIVSFGKTRKIEFNGVPNSGCGSSRIGLLHGNLLVMWEPTNKNYEYKIAKNVQDEEPWISLKFLNVTFGSHGSYQSIFDKMGLRDEPPSHLLSYTTLPHEPVLADETTDSENSED